MKKFLIFLILIIGGIFFMAVYGYKENKCKELVYTNIINVKDFGAKGDGITDDTTNIQKAIDYAYKKKLGGVYLPEGTYMVKCDTFKEKMDNYTDVYSGLSLKSNMDIIMHKETKMKVIPTSSGSYALFDLRHCENVSIIGGNLIGDRDTHTGTDGEYGFGIHIEYSNNIQIKDINISDFWGDGIFTGFASTGNQYGNILIDNCTIDNCRRDAISLCGGKNIKISNCRLINTNGKAGQCGIDVETYEGYLTVTNIYVDRCYFEGNVGYDILVCNRTLNLNVTNCEFNGNYTSGRNILITAGNDYIISNNINHSGRLLLEVNEGVTNVTFENNRIYENKWLIYIGTCEHINIIGNKLINSIKTTDYAIRLYGTCRFINISQNIIRSVGIGIYSDNTAKLSRINISDNSIFNSGTGMFLASASCNALNINNNNITNMSENGINIQTQNANIVNNEILNCVTHYIVTGGTGKLTIKNNNCLNNGDVLPGQAMIYINSTPTRVIVNENNCDSYSGSELGIVVEDTTNLRVLMNNTALHSTQGFNILPANAIKHNNIMKPS